MEAADEQQRPDHQDHRQCRLTGDQDPLSRRPAPILRRAARAGMKGAAGLDAAGTDDRRQAEEKARRRGDHDREGQDAPVDLEHERRRARIGRERPDQQSAQRLGQGHSQGRAYDREQPALGQELSRQSRARAAQREPDGDLTVAGGGARQQEVGEVAAGHQQHQPGHPEQQPERPIVAIPQLAHARGHGICREPIGLPALDAGFAVADWRRSLEEAAAEGIDVRRRAFVAPTRSEPSDDRYLEQLAPQLVRAAARQAHRDHDVELLADREAGERRRRHADDLHHLAVEAQAVRRRQLAPAELAHPVTVAHHRALGRARLVGAR